jgi:hypothetical protein
LRKLIDDLEREIKSLQLTGNDIPCAKPWEFVWAFVLMVVLMKKETSYSRVEVSESILTCT